MKFYSQGRKEGDFESGIRLALAGHSGQPAVPVPPRAGADAENARGFTGSAIEDIALAAVVLPVGHRCRTPSW